MFDDRDCLIGDAASNVNVLQYLGAKYCADFITDMDAFYESWEKVLRLGARCFYPAHGIPFRAEKLKANLWKNEAKNLVPYHPR
jgi:glyoxylase-like metal-dependent hydrolase (beta-lactamase superfamily II)